MRQDMDERHSESGPPAAPLQQLGDATDDGSLVTAPARREPADPGWVALAAGLVGLLTGPVLIGDPTARYVILVADIVALAVGAVALWAVARRGARLDVTVAAILCGGVSLFLYISYVTNPPQGGT